MRKIDVLDLFAHVVQHHAALERSRAQMRRQQRKVARRQRRQESVGFAVLELAGNRGRAVRHRWRSCSKRRRARQANQVKNAFTDSALRSAYRSDVQLIYVQEVPMTALQRHPTRLYHPPGTTTRCGGECRGGLFAMR